METFASENAPPGKVKSKAVKAAMAPAGPLQASTAFNAGQPGGGKSIEEIYQKKTQLEHILLRPDTYVGSVEKITAPMWVHEAAGSMVQRNVSYVPGLYKIFDEILVNAADNRARDSTMDTLRVDLDAAAGSIRVYNNGAGVPVQMHAEEKVYVPELIFGHLLTSSNYNDAEKKVTGGRNGYGAKLANIFSTEFVVETCDGSRGRRYRQVFRNNMGVKGTPEITACKSSENWTCISFKPDLAKFGMAILEEDTLAIMRRRVYDMAGCLGKGVKVFLNGVRLPVSSFQDYVGLFLQGRDSSSRVYERANERWEVVVTTSEGQFNQVSFVNSICTSKGGTHVNAVTDEVVSRLLEHIAKKHKQTTVKPFQVKSHLWVFVNAKIENPAFDSQTKETLTSRASSFGSKCDLSDDFSKKLLKCGVVENVLEWAKFKQANELKKTDGAKRQRLTGIKKLDDANDAGGRMSESCTLILTEGDSAKALAVSGLAVVGRDRFGVFPLRGKLLNVRDATHAQIMNNEELNNIKQILGLQHGQSYDASTIKKLRYGQLMIMTDQDHDGSHIKGLLINFIHHHFPSLLKIPGFLVEFITPIVKASKGRTVHTFYTMPQYDAWKESLGGSTRGWAIKYYKGLGTSTAAEAKDYFSHMETHRKSFVWDSEEAGQLIDMAFSKKKVEARKDWLRSFEPGTYLDQSGGEVAYTDFINRELILFSMEDLARSIPALMDGFKPSQRKVMFACFKRKLKADIKVAQLAGYVSEHAAYHHGEVSLASTIVGLAQDFVGSNNVSVLVPSGQFGTRLQGGKDSASPRYIFTRLDAIARLLFPEADDQLLAYLNEDGQLIEPTFYLPVLPMVLVNGAEGIGTGWSTSIPNFNPRDVAANLVRLIDCETPTPMVPWYKGFKGTVERSTSKASTSYTITGVITQLSATQLEISELPVHKWVQDYKEYLEELIKPEDKATPAFITDYKEYHTDTSVRFVITMPEDKMKEALEIGLTKKFKLTTSVSTSNMHLFNTEGVIQKYDTPEAILAAFFPLRLATYDRRKAALLKTSEAEMLRLDNKVRFITAVLAGEIKLNNRKKADIVAELGAKGYARLAKAIPRGAVASDPATVATPEMVEGGEEDSAVDGGDHAGTYDYLLGMPLYALTHEKVNELASERVAKQSEVARLRATAPADMWRSDLEAVLTALDAADAAAVIADEAAAKVSRAVQAKGKKAAGVKGKKAKRAWGDSDEDTGDDDDEGDAPKKRAPAAPKPRAPSAAAKVTALAPAPVPVKKTIVKSRSAVVAPAASLHVDLVDDDNDNAGVAPKVKPVAKGAAKKKAPAGGSGDEGEDYVPTLAERLAARAAGLMAAPSVVAAPKAAVTKVAWPTTVAVPDAPPVDRPTRTAAARVASYVGLGGDDDDDDDGNEANDGSSLSGSEEDDDASMGSPTPAKPKKKAAPIPKAVDTKPAAKPAKAVKPAVVKKPAAAKASRATVVDDGDDDDAALDLTAASPAVTGPSKKVQRLRPSPFSKASGPAVPVAAARPARARAQVSYATIGSESEEEDDDAESDASLDEEEED